jgi:hypothetical protein
LLGARIKTRTATIALGHWGVSSSPPLAVQRSVWTRPELGSVPQSVEPWWKMLEHVGKWWFNIAIIYIYMAIYIYIIYIHTYVYI